MTPSSTPSPKQEINACDELSPTAGQARFGFSPWIALLVAIVLCLATLGSVFSNYHGAVTTMERILLEKGASLIRSFEAGARMRMRHASDIRLQLLLEEMASQEDIRFTAVISKEGLILAHSDPALIDTWLVDGVQLETPTTAALSDGINDSAGSINNSADSINHDTDVINHNADAINNGPDVINNDHDVINHNPDSINNGPSVINNDNDSINNGQDSINHDPEVINDSSDSINNASDMINHNPDIINASFDATDVPQWHIMTLGGTTSFVVYEAFNPLHEMGSGPNNGGPRDGLRDGLAGGLGDGRPDRLSGPKHSSHTLPERPKEFWDTITSLRSTNTDGAIMLVGLNIEPLDAAQAQDRRIRTLVLILLLGSALLSALALWRFQKERLAQQKERMAQQKERMAQQKERLAQQKEQQALAQAQQSLEKEQQALLKEQLAQQKEQQAQEQVRALEAEIRQREKQAAMGHLAAGVAHELRNPLSSIKGYATYFGTRFPEGSEDRHAAAIMVQEVDRLNRVITDLINLAKPSDLHLVDHDATALHLLVDRALRLIHHEAVARGVTVHFHCAADLPNTALDPDRFLQALLNVWLNALDAFKATSQQLSTPDASPAQERSLYVDLTGSANGKLHVTTRDTGSGIAPDQLSKICDPYFTTKPQGTGLGLAIVQKIIEAHGGRMDVVSEVGVGTVVDFVM
ncbi:MAG: ATP-binding protein [Pseudomonadota bacterium]